MKKLFVFILTTLCYLATTNQITAQTVASDTTGTCTWTITGTAPNYTLTIAPTDGISGAMADHTYTNRPWDGYRTNLKTLVIAQGVTKIGDYAFQNYSGFTGPLTIPNSVTSIGNFAFQSCGFTGSLTIPDLVTFIGMQVFFNCSGITDITVDPNNTTYSSIAGVLFNKSQTRLMCCPAGLTGTYTISDWVISIDNGAFLNCTGLTSITVDANNTTYSSDADGVLFNKNQTILICCPAGKTGSYSIPNVTTIRNHAFSYCSGLTGSLIIPSSVTSIGDNAFSNCSGFTGSLTIPNSVTSIGQSAFSGCSGLKSVIISSSVTSIANNVCFGCSSLTSVTIPISVTSIGMAAFQNCSSLASVTIPDSVTILGNSAFQNCSSLTSVIIGNSVATIGAAAFYGCSSLENVIIPDSVTSIGQSAFSGCSGLKSVIISNSVTIIYGSTFSGCSSLDNVIIPDLVTSIEYGAFLGCTGLKSVTIGNSVVTINVVAFYNCYSLTSVTIPNSVTSIEQEAFNGCSGLKSVTIGDSVVTIGGAAFRYCKGLTSVTIPNSVTTIGSHAFAYCDSLKSVTIGASVTTIGNYAFVNCRALKEMYVNAVNPPVIDSATFTNVPRNIPVYVPCGTKTDYETAILWDQFTNIIDRPAIILQVNNTVLGRVDTIQAYTCENDTVIIAAVPKSCYYFVAWDDDSTSNPRTFVLSRDTTFTAVFDSIIIALKDTIICYNTPATVTVSSNVPSAVYQWYSSLTDLTPFHTGSSYTTSNLTSDSTFYIDILGSDYCINGEIIRQSVTVTVYDSLIGGSIVEVDPYCYNSIHPTIEYFGEELPIGGSGNYSYQWQSSIDSAKTWTEIGTGKQTYTLSGELEHKTTLYRRVVTDKYGCGTVFSDTLTVHPVPTISAKLTEICPGVTTQVFPNRDGRWESSDSNIVDIIDSSTIVGKTPGTAKLTFYDSLAGSCSAPLSIIVTAFPDPEEITGDKVVCEEKEVVLSNTTPGGVWTHNNDNISIITQTNAPDKATVTLKGEKVGKSFVTYTVANGNGLCKSKRTFRLKIIDNTLPKVIIGIKR